MFLRRSSLGSIETSSASIRNQKSSFGSTQRKTSSSTQVAEATVRVSLASHEPVASFFRTNRILCVAPVEQASQWTHTPRGVSSDVGGNVFRVFFGQTASRSSSCTSNRPSVDVRRTTRTPPGSTASVPSPIGDDRLDSAPFPAQ